MNNSNNSTTSPQQLHFSPSSVAAAGILSLLGVILNSTSAYYISTRFDIDRSVFILMLADATVSLVSSAASIFVSLVIMTNEENAAGICFALFVSGYLPMLLGNLVTAEIAVIRLYSLRLATSNIPMDEKRVKRLSLLLLLFPPAYIALKVTLGLIHHTPFSMIYETCMWGNDAPVPPSPLLLLSYLLPTLTFPLVSMVAGAKIVCIVKKHSQRAQGQSTIPVRATVLSAAMLLPSLVIAVLIQVIGLSKSDAAAISNIEIRFVVGVRCALTTAVCFAHKQSLEEAARRDTRDARLKREIWHAEQSQKERKTAGVHI